MTGLFADAAPIYRGAGWLGTLPIPAHAKTPVPQGFTGAAGVDPNDATVAYWAANGQADGNIGLRMPTDAIGVDVDAYGAKHGAATLAYLQSTIGPLPRTWTSSARPAPSGIRFFRVPTGLSWVGSLPGDIDIISRGYRYAVVEPSIHPDGMTYRWFAPDGSLAGRPPFLGELTALPPAWITRLTTHPPTVPSAPVSDFFQPAKRADSAYWQWERLRARVTGFVRHCVLFGWGGDAHGQLLEMTRELAQLAPAHAYRAIGEWFAAAGAGYVDDRVWAMLESALGKYPADKIVAPGANAGGGQLGASGATISAPGASLGVTPTWPPGGDPGTETTSVRGLAPGAGSATTHGSGAPTPSAGPHRSINPNGMAVAPAGVLPVSSGATELPPAYGVAGATTGSHARAHTAGESTSRQSVPGGDETSVTPPRRLPMIPDRVWNTYGWSRSIRAQARAADVCPDAVLGAMLATYASRIPPGVRIVTGTKMPLGANLVVSLVGPSGSDKSTAFNLARRMMPGSAVPVINNPGSGEAFAATFVHPDPDFDGPAKSRPKVLKPDPRALFYVAEGALMGSIGSRLGSTWLPHLRSLAVDESLSTTNATAEINRQVPAQRYRAAVVIGFQVTTATPVLHDTGTGTAQRFLWFTSLSSEPRGLSDDAPHVPMATVHETRLSAGVDDDNEVLHYLTVTRSITERIIAEQEHTRLTRDITTTDDHDAHRHTLVAKLAALAVLADGRVMIEEGDWLWAEALYAASAATRDALLDIAEESAEGERASFAQQQGRADRLRKRIDSDETRVAEVIMRRSQKVGVATRRQLRDAVESRDRGLFAGAFDLLVKHGWLTNDGSGKFYAASQNTGQ